MGEYREVAGIHRTQHTFGLLVTRKPECGPVTYEDQRLALLEKPAIAQERTYSEETAAEMDRAVRALVEVALRRASAILQTRRDVLERGAALLIAKETLVENDLNALIAPETEARAQAAAQPLTVVSIGESAATGELGARKGRGK